jgi:predicted nucleotidyltransferase component of viral defense system
MSKTDIAKSIHQRLLNVRDKTGENFNNLLVRYGLERLLYRLVISEHADSFVLKGAMLFTLWHGIPGRPTRDIDLLGLGHPTHERLRQIFTDACKAQVEEDGLEFDSKSIHTEDIRDDQEYFGVRIRLVGFLGNARIPIQIDVGFGDAVIPPPEKIDYPTLLGLPTPRLLVYHPVTVIAEKVNAMVVHGFMYSRMKDFYDIYILLNYMKLDDDVLAEAIRATFQRRKIELPSELPVAFTPDFLADGNKETQWRAFLNRSKLSEFSFSIAEVLNALRERLWPILQKAKK